MDKKNINLMVDAATMVRKFVPETTIIPKELSKFHNFIGFFSKDYKRYWTTIGYEIAHPADTDWTIIFHEGVHVRQAKKYTRPGFAFLYLFPQVLALLAILGVFLSPLWLLSLLFLLPLPAPFRMLFELEAYSMTVYTTQWKDGSQSDMKNLIDFILLQFTGKGYWYMWPFTGYIKRKLYKAQEDAFFLRHTVNDPYEIEVLQFLLDNNKIEKHGIISGIGGTD